MDKTIDRAATVAENAHRSHGDELAGLSPHDRLRRASELYVAELTRALDAGVPPAEVMLIAQTTMMEASASLGGR